MADKKISQLTSATTPLAGTEVLPIVQGGSTVKVAVSDLTSGRAISASDITDTSLTASSAVATDANKKLVSVTNTGSGNNVLATSPVLTTPDIGAATGTSVTVGSTIMSGTDILAKTVLGTSSITDSYTLYRGTPDTSGYEHAKVIGTRDITTGWTYGSQLDFYTEGKHSGSTDTSTVKMSIYANGDIKNTLGNFVVGTSGKGIDFSATASGSGTMTSELLADYEEGTWVPTLRTNGVNFASVTYDSIVGGKYVKIGNMVYIQGALRTNAVDVTGANGDICIGGLPYTVGASTSGANGFGAINMAQVAAWTTNNPCTGYANQGSTYILLFYRSTANGVSNTLAVADVATGASSNLIIFSGCYTTV